MKKDEKTLEEVAEERLSVLKLLEGAEWVFNHPILRHIVETAPSPKAADQYVSKLLYGLPYANKTAKAVRMVVRARQKMAKNGEGWEKSWQTLTENTDNEMALYNICDIPGLGILGVAEGLYWYPEVGLMDIKKWPFLLKEFRLQGYSTLPNPKNSWESVRSIEEKEVNLISFGYGQGIVKAGGPGEIFLNHGFMPEAAKFYATVGESFGQTYICSVNVMVSPNPNQPIPRFYKVVKITKDNSKERIFVVCPIDRNMFINGERDSHADGYMIYEKTIPVMHGVEAVLKLKFDIYTDGRVVVRGTNQPLISINTRDQDLMLLSSEFTKSYTKAYSGIAELYPLLVGLWEDTNKFGKLHLSQFTDLHIITNPAENLHELFTRGRSL